MLVSAEHPVAMRRAEFWTVSNFLMDLSEMMVDQVGLAYSKMGRVIALYVCDMVSMDMPHLVVVSDLRMLLVFLAFSVMVLMCVEKVSCGSKVTPRILGLRMVGIVVLLMVRDRLSLNSALSGVKRVAVDLSGLRVSSLAVVHW